MDANIEEKFDRISEDIKLKKLAKHLKKNNDCPKCEISYLVDKMNGKKVCNKCGRCIPHNARPKKNSNIEQQTLAHFVNYRTV